MSKQDKFYYKDGTISSEYDAVKILHRVGAPAVVHLSGNKFWYINDKLHRIDGPAVEYADGTFIEYAFGSKSWWVEDERYSEKDFNKLIAEVKQLPLALRLIDSREWVRSVKL